MRYLIYTRVSERGSDWQGESSCTVQAEECRRYIQGRDPAAVFDAIQDEFRSGRTVAKRPALLSALKAAESGSAPWDVLVTLDMDRLSRSLEGWLQVAKVLASAGKGLVCIRQDMDYRTPQGRLVLNLFATVAEYFAHSNAQKTRDKMLAIANRGEWPAGRVPMGYRRSGKSLNALAIDPAAVETVREIFRDAATLHVTALSRKYKLPPNTLRKMLRNETYVGRIKYGGVDVKGKHPPIIDQGTYNKAQTSPGVITDHPPRPARQQYPYALTGLVRDSEGHAMSPATCRGKMRKQYPYYRCTAPCCPAPMRYVRADLLEAAVCKTIADLAYNKAALRDMADGIARQAAAIRAHCNQDGDIHAELRTAENRSKRLLDALAASDALPTARQAILNELEAIQRQANALKAKAQDMEKRLGLLAGYTDPAQFAKWFHNQAVLLTVESATAPQFSKKDWCHAHIHSVVIQPDGKPRIKVWLHEAGSTRDGTWHPEGLLVELPPLPSLKDAQPPARTAAQMSPRRGAQPPRQ